MARYSGDPRWLTARFDSTCRKCGKRIKRGESIFYYPTGKVTYCAGECGKAASRDFEAAAFDESVYGGGKKRHASGKSRLPRGLVGLYATRPESASDPHWMHDVIRIEFTWHGKPMVAVKHKGGPAELYVVNDGLELFSGYCAPKVTQGLCGAVNNYFKKKALGYREDDFRTRAGFKVTSYRGPGLPLSTSASGKRKHSPKRKAKHVVKPTPKHASGSLSAMRARQARRLHRLRAWL